MKLILGSIIAAALSSAAVACPVPPLDGHPVADAGSVLSLEQESRLEGLLTEANRAGGHQIAVATLASLQGDSVEPCANSVFRSWKLGNAQRDDGVLILVAVKERKVDIEVGYGLEGTLTDALSGQIIRGRMVPKLKTGDYAGGLEAGVLAVAEVINAPEAVAAPPAPAQSADYSWLLWLGAPLGLGGFFILRGWRRWKREEEERAAERKRALEALQRSPPPRSRGLGVPGPAARAEEPKSVAPRKPAKPSTADSTSSRRSRSDYSGYSPPSYSSSSYDSGSSSSSSYSSDSSSFSGGGGDSGGGGASGDF